MPERKGNDVSDARDDGFASGPMWMFLGAALFGYFGFTLGTTSPSTGQPLPLYVTLVWTLRVAAVAFFVSAFVVMAQPLLGNLLYSVVGLASAIMFLVIAGWDVLDKQYATAIPPFLLVIFAVWNGYSSWQGLRAVLAARRRGRHGMGEEGLG